MTRRGRKVDLQAIIAEATVDSYNEDEARTNFATAICDELPVPFKARVLGDEVEVTGLTISAEGLVEAIIPRGRKDHRVALLSLEVPRDTPKVEWLEAYRKFLRSQ